MINRSGLSRARGIEKEEHMGQRPATMITLTVLLIAVPAIALAQTPKGVTLKEIRNGD